ncbi:MAG: bifunctional diaminohydroxyphosphoribosylaminopyrimidine deaminase/5-amino-6-(5-phosphoribosylamino)uracil reductase RibD [Capnocytophaga sp.]|nr:bifunctional diaminohydroxyphosphoribosylaminopyrimidine deaminase/5-amino-6-(5-phosphoribosylamino)uracil reductase RibD [Capnocytophaga sp.]
MEHNIYMKRCLQLASNAIGYTYPNPLVGSVIVHNGKIIGEGWHTKQGEPHAEVNAIHSILDESLLKDSTLYVNLEPCAHFGKTPPCANLILEKKIPKVVVGTVDIHSKVAGKGIELLKNNGVEVIVGVLEQECKAINRRFFTFHDKKRPYIILKWAQTQDNFIAPLQKEVQQPVWITNNLSQQLVHQWRSEEQAILVGVNTILQDNPSLNTRHWIGNNPLRLVIDPHLKTNESHSIYKEGKSVIFTFKEAQNTTNITFFQLNPSQSIPQQVCNYLYEKEIQSLIVEGGTFTLQKFIEEGFWDEARVFIGNKIWKNGIKSPQIPSYPYKTQYIEDDTLLFYQKI